MQRSFLRFGLWSLGIILLLGVVAAGVWQYRHNQWKWAEIPMPEPTATVNKEVTPAELGTLLLKKNKVRDADAFADAARKKGITRIRPGVYQLPQKADPKALASVFGKPPSLFKVTFPEGWTARQMAEKMHEGNIGPADAFRHLVYPANTEISPWEGRLFPDTYLLPRGATANDVIQMMHSRFAGIIEELPRPFPQWSAGKVLSVAQLTTLASLVERETSIPEERALIAGVILNRLRRGMRLQIDATVQYARIQAAARGKLEQGHKERLFYSDLKINSPYNTYIHKGLPPAPICNPGADALHAAARPKASNYLFYVWSPKQKRHLFAETYENHMHNVRLVRQESN